jgi:adenylate cyclase
VVVVAIDDETLATETAGTLSRRGLLARLADNIAQSGARTLALDVLLADAGNANEDAALAATLSALPASIAAAATFGPDATDVGLIWPQERFRAVATAGLVNVSTDPGGTPRFVPLLVQTDDALIASLSLVAALSFSEDDASVTENHLELGTHKVPLDGGYNMPLRHLGPAGSIPTVSATALLDGPVPNELSDKIAVLGYTAAATGDQFVTPFDDDTPGVEIIATAISQLIGGPTLRRDTTTRRWDATHATALTLIGVSAVVMLPLAYGVTAAVVLALLSFGIVTAFFAAGLWLSAALPLAAAVPPMLLAGAVRYFQERAQARQSERTVASLRRFQSPALAAKLEQNPEYLARPEEHDLIVYFVDLTGFTALAQRLGADGTQKLLGLFHNLTGEIVGSRGGSVLNFMGDGALAVFGLDGTSAAVADKALDAAVTLVRTLASRRLDHPDIHLRCRIGLHKGPATLSRLGTDSHKQLTVSGDTVNLASRLMEVAKDQSAVIVASADFTKALSDSKHLQGAEALEVPIRGRDGRVGVFFWTRAALG